MSDLTYIKSITLEAFVAGDGQGFTDLIKRWAKVFFPLHGVAHDQFSINGVSFRADGGTDGLITSPTLRDPLGLLAPKTVFQFKAGKFTKGDAKAELLNEAADGSTRVIDHLRNGYKLVWFCGKALTDTELKKAEDELAEIVNEIQPGLPKPVIIDANRLCAYLTLTPVVACRLVNAEGAFLTSNVALTNPPHTKFAKFVPGQHFDKLRDDVVGFFLNQTSHEPIKYIAGEPGIGKSRSVLEAIEASPELAGLVCYFEDPTNIKSFFATAKQEGWVGFCIIDEYIGQSSGTILITSENIPRGMRVILIGHSYWTNRGSVQVTNQLEPLSEEEAVAALAATFEALPEFRIRDAIGMAKKNLRLARSICSYYARDPNATLGADGLEQVVDYELLRMPHGKEVLAHLALVPMLLADDLNEFCAVTSNDPATFKRVCREVKDSSGLIQFNDHVMYVGAPAIAQVSLIRLWREDKDKVAAIFANAGKFLDDILTSVRRLPPCQEKEEMLSFFRVPVANLSLDDLLDAETGKRLLHLLTADPEMYLTAIHRVIKENVGQLHRYPYEGVVFGRSDLIWRLRDLAQFEEYFEKAEEIVYLLAREEVSSAYHNVASGYWAEWFRPYFDHTVYPYEKRLDLLERRVRGGDQTDRELVVQAIADPFPQTGMNVPSDRVGGRLAPPELQFIHHAQIRTAIERIPPIFELLLAVDDAEFKRKVGSALVNASFDWLEMGAVEWYAGVVMSEAFPTESLQQLVLKTRRYVGLRDELGEQPEDPRLKKLHDAHQKLLTRIDTEDDPFLEAREIADHGYWGDNADKAAYKRQARVLDQCLADPAFRSRVIDLMADPEKHGGGPFGKLFGKHLDLAQSKELLDEVWRRGFSQFSYAALRVAAEEHEAIRSQLLEEARSHELTHTRTALSLYQLLGDETLYAESTRILNETDIPSSSFGHFWFSSIETMTDSVRGFIAAVTKRVEGGEATASEVAIHIAGELAQHAIKDPEAYALGLLALNSCDPERGSQSLVSWNDIGEWLLSVVPDEVIAIAASKDQGLYSPATALLATAAAEHPEEVLTAVTPKLKNPYKSPILLSGGLIKVFTVITPQTLRKWLPAQPAKVWEAVAGHLPKPFGDEASAEMPAVTRAFWDLCLPEHPAFAHALEHFEAHTYGTGVYGGHGIDLYSARVAMAKKFLTDPNSGIRKWAEEFLKVSEYRLGQAYRSQSLSDAERDTYE